MDEGHRVNEEAFPETWAERRWRRRKRDDCCRRECEKGSNAISVRDRRGKW